MLLELTKHNDPQVRLETCKQVLDRGFGRPKQQSEHRGTVEHQLTVNAAHLAAVRDLSRRALDHSAKDARLIEDLEPIEVTSESKDAAKFAYAERMRSEGQ